MPWPVDLILVPRAATPSSLTNGQVWILTDGVRVRVNSATKLLANVGTKLAFVLPVGTDMWATSAE